MRPAADHALPVPHRVLLLARVSARPLAHAQAGVPAASVAGVLADRLRGVGCRRRRVAGPTFDAKRQLGANSTQNGDRREGEAYAASTAATYDGSTASGADADTDEWSRSRAYPPRPHRRPRRSTTAWPRRAPAKTPTTTGAATARPATRGESPTRDDVTAARLAAARQAQAQAPAEGQHAARRERRRRSSFAVWSAADEAAAAEVFDLTTPHEARDFDDANVGIEDVRRDLRGSIRLAPPVDDDAGSPAASRARRRRASARPSKQGRAGAGPDVRRGGQVPRGSRPRPGGRHGAIAREPVLTDAALDALLPAGASRRWLLLRPAGRRPASPTSSRWSPTTAAVSSFLFRRDAAARGPRGPPSRRGAVGPNEAEDDADEWRQAVDDAGVPYFVSATGETARAAGAWLSRPAAGARRTARIRSRGDWVEALDWSSGRVYYANAAGAVQSDAAGGLDDDEEEEDVAACRLGGAAVVDEFDDRDDAPPREPPIERASSTTAGPRVRRRRRPRASLPRRPADRRRGRRATWASGLGLGPERRQRRCSGTVRRGRERSCWRRSELNGQAAAHRLAVQSCRLRFVSRRRRSAAPAVRPGAASRRRQRRPSAPSAAARA